MGLVKYAEDDRIPLVLNVLSFVVKWAVTQLQRVAYEEEYADLKGLVQTNHVDEESVRLLLQSDDEAIKLSLAVVDEVLLCMDRLALRYQLEVEEVLNDARLIALAEPIFWSAACAIDDAGGYPKRVNNLYVYFGSVSMLMPLCCHLLKGTDLDLANCNHYSPVYAMPDKMEAADMPFLFCMKHLEAVIVSYLRDMEGFLMDLYFLKAE